MRLPSLSWKINKPYVLFCPHSIENYGYVGTEAIDQARLEVLEAIRKLHNKAFVIKLHPSHDDRKFYKKFKLKNARILWKADTRKLIERSSLVIVQHSTVALDALDANKPVILIEDEVSDKLGEFDEFDCFLRARKSEDIVRLIEAYS